MLRKFARPMLASVYIADGVDTVKNAEDHAPAASAWLNRVKAVLPKQYEAFVPANGKMVAQAVGGTKAAAGTLLALGKAPRTSAGVLAALSIPTILSRHAFWETSDAKEKAAQKAGFMTDIALLGGVLITTGDTEGKPGLLWRGKHAAIDAGNAIQGALPGREASQNFAESFIDDAKDKAQDFGEKAQDFGAAAALAGGAAATQAKGFFADAADKVQDFVEDAKDYYEDNKDDWLEFAQSNAKVAKKRAVKAAAQARDKAQDAASTAQAAAADYQQTATKRSKKAAKKADKRWGKAQKQADKSLRKAKKKLAKKLSA